MSDVAAAETPYKLGRAALSAEVTTLLRFTKIIKALLEKPMTSQTKDTLISIVDDFDLEWWGQGCSEAEGSLWPLLREDFEKMCAALVKVVPVQVQTPAVPSSET